MQPRPPSLSRPVTWWWFLVPLITLGFGTFVMVLLGGVMLRSWAHKMAAGFYFALIATFCVGAQYTQTGRAGPLDAVLMLALVIAWLGGVAHVATLQVLVRGQAAAAAPAPMSTGVDPALAAAQWRAARRQETRALLASNPGLAAELDVGRPDVRGRHYDDGGLVDVNHLSADWLATELDLPGPVAATVVAERDRLGGFSNPEELVVYCAGMTPERLEIVRDRLVFIPI